MKPSEFNKICKEYGKKFLKEKIRGESCYRPLEIDSGFINDRRRDKHENGIHTHYSRFELDHDLSLFLHDPIIQFGTEYKINLLDEKPIFDKPEAILCFRQDNNYPMIMEFRFDLEDEEVIYAQNNNHNLSSALAGQQYNLFSDVSPSLIGNSLEEGVKTFFSAIKRDIYRDKSIQ